MRSTTSDSGTRTFLDVCADLFSLVLYLREQGDIRDPDGLYHEVATRIAPLEVDEKPREPKDYAIYALVGFIDETMASKSNLRWKSRLEMSFFGTNVAGNDFYKHLDRILETQAKQPQGGALEVYYLCLTLGFGGELAEIPGIPEISEKRRARRQKYIDDLKKLIDPETVEKLSPRGDRPQETIKQKRSRVPRWLPWVVAGGCAAIMIFLFIFLKIGIARWAGTVIDGIRSVKTS